MPTKRRARPGQTGSAFLEFFFAFPFLLFIMVLGINFCKTYLMQQRAMVAARYVAWADVEHLPAPDSAKISSLFFNGEPVEVSSAAASWNSEPNSAMGGVANDASQQGSILAQLAGTVSGVLTGISSTEQYTVSYHYQPLFAAVHTLGQQSWYPDLQITGTVAVDSKDWRYPNPSFQQMAGGLVNGALRGFGWIVHHL